MKERFSPSTLIIVGIVLITLAAFLMTSQKRNTEKYSTRGIEVQCETVEVLTGRKGRQTVTGAYVNKSGETVLASVTRNASTYVGEKYTGYTLPESPDTVYCIPSDSMLKIMKMVNLCVGGAGCVLLLVGIIAVVVKKARDVY
ncbi:hypothetical protein SAMN02910447_01701 [Ruminococcus sp. YE71]|uniref:hypothetical protein n=1 Tax=unclassified Ruminococcus TaxID=2608920 RepID=UPI000890B8CF|nr:MULTISPECIES: hypothetical protein [unclassified Ruminococcus]SDA20169.1 hypothetical protein SAMN02910446_01702 [Ruminococcus sp. YE78]SFW31947.1 hypothetical protein SAMN02910447_01701 [Ruminococcus sp. YE71]